MNKRAYRLVFSKRLGMLVPVALGLSIVGLGSTSAQTTPLPTGGQVVQGAGSISQTANTLTVQQNTQLLGVNWQSFNIGAGNTVQFVQPNAQAVAINRVLGNDRSEIFGNLKANGQVFLLNPNGVLFGANAQVDVGALVASTARQASQGVDGSWTFSDKGTGQVVNQGHIKAKDGGFVVLDSAAQTINAGTIEANRGGVALTVAQNTRIALDAQGQLNVNVDGAVLQALVSNQGLILADGGAVHLTARGKNMLLNSVVNQTGVIKARSVQNRNGRIFLSGGDSGKVQVSGTLDVSGKEAGQTGGGIQVTGEHIQISQATLDASGPAGGGRIEVGGGFQGASLNGQTNAQTTTVDETSVIDVSSTGAGNGGTAIVWSDQETNFKGQIDGRAKNAEIGGNGGFAEVSGKLRLNYQGKANLLSANTPRKTGDLLLDPYNLTISSSADSGMSSFDASADDSVLNVTTLQNQLGTANVTVTTGSSGSQTGNITVSNALTWGSANTTLTLDAAGGVVVNAGISYTGTSAGGLVLKASGTGGISGNSSGTIAIGAGQLTANVNNASGTGTLAGVISGTGGTLLKTGAGTLTLTGTNTYTGDTTVSQGTLDVKANAAAAGATTGAITLGDANSGSNNITLVVDGGASYRRSGVLTISAAGSGVKTVHSQNGTAGGVIDHWQGGIVFVGAAVMRHTTQFINSDAYRNNSTWSGAGHVTIEGDTAFTYLGGDKSAFSGGITANLFGVDFRGSYGGALTVGSSGAVWLVVNESFSSINGSGTIAALGRSGTSTKNLTVQSGTFSGVLSNDNGAFGQGSLGATPLALVKSGSGTLTLSGANTYTGGTMVSGGTLQAGHASAFGSSSAITLANTAGVTLDLNSNSVSIGSLAGGGSTGGNLVLGSGTLTTGADNSSTSFGGVISGTGGLTKTGTGTQTLTGANTYTGATTVSGGTLQAGHASALGSSSAVSLANTAGVTLDLNSNSVSIGSLAGGGSTGGNLALGSGTLTTGADNSSTSFGGVISGTGGLSKTGSGTQTLTGASTYSGTTTVNAGTLNLGNGGTTGSLASSASIVSNSSLLIDRSDAVSLSALLGGNISGTGDVTVKSNAGVTVNRNITMTGTSSAITLLAGNATAAGTATGGDVTFGAGNTITNTAIGTVTIFSGNADTTTIDSKITGATGGQYKRYNAATATTSATVTGARNLFYRQTTSGSITLSGVSVVAKTYDGTQNATLTGGTFTGSFDNLTASLPTTGTFNSADVATATTVTFAMPSGSSSDGYTVIGGIHVGGQTSANATISAKALTVTGNTTSVVFNGSAQTNGYTTSGLVGSDSITGVSGLATGTAEGSYSDNLSAATGTGLGNYTISYVNGRLRITSKSGTSSSSFVVTKDFSDALPDTDPKGMNTPAHKIALFPILKDEEWLNWALRKR